MSTTHTAHYNSSTEKITPRCVEHYKLSNEKTTRNRDRNFTSAFGVGNATEEDSDEPLERVLVHGVDARHICDTKEQDLRVHRHRDVLASHFIDILLRLLRHHDLSLRYIGHKVSQASR